MHIKISIKTKVSLLLLATMGVMSGIAIVASLPLIANNFTTIQNIEFYSKLLLIIPSIIIAVASPFTGILVDKIGRLIPLYIGFTLFVIGGSSGFFLDDFYYLLVGRAILGIGVAFTTTSSMALVGDYFNEEERHKFMSVQGMAIGFGGIIFIISGGYLAQIDWQYPFLIYSLPILFLPLLLISLKEPNRTKEITIEENEVNTKLYPVYLTAFFSMLLFYMLPTQMPYLVINKLGGNPSSVAYFIAFAMFTNAITSKQYHKLKAKLNFIQIFAIIYISFGIGLAIISQVTTPNQLFLASMFMGIGFGLVFVNINVWLLSLVEASKRGRAIGVLTSSFFFGQFFSPILFQPVVASIGIQGLFFYVSILSFLIAFVLFIKSKV